MLRSRNATVVYMLISALSCCVRVRMWVCYVKSNRADLWGNPLPAWLKVIITLAHTKRVKVKLAITPSAWLLPKPLYQRLEEKSCRVCACACVCVLGLNWGYIPTGADWDWGCLSRLRMHACLPACLSVLSLHSPAQAASPLHRCTISYRCDILRVTLLHLPVYLFICLFYFFPQSAALKCFSVC